jgi:hypothetical protein
MFERFTSSARNVVVGAQRSAVELGHPYIGTEHLLLGLLDPASGGSAEILHAAGVQRERVLAEIDRLRAAGAPPLLGPADVEALRAIGIDVDAVVAAIEASFGPGALHATRVPEWTSWTQRLHRRTRWLRPRFVLRRWRRRRDHRRDRCREVRLRQEYGVRQEARGGHRPFVPRSKKVLELSLREAIRLRHHHIGPEHILLGLLREGDGLAAQVLVETGISLDDLRQRTLRALLAAA